MSYLFGSWSLSRARAAARACGTVLLSRATARRSRQSLIRAKPTPGCTWTRRQVLPRPVRHRVDSSPGPAYPAVRRPCPRALVAQWTEHAPPKRGMQVRLLPGASPRRAARLTSEGPVACATGPSGAASSCEAVRLAVRDDERAGDAAAVRLDEDLAGVRRGSVGVAHPDVVGAAGRGSDRRDDLLAAQRLGAVDGTRGRCRADGHDRADERAAADHAEVTDLPLGTTDAHGVGH